ncbi:glycosyltransferase family 4 protein [Caminicella sporogenes]|uniref:glycosyltransferase family 4 protein n=1 Tax=Caminicella sporogenes TaxID=166485 RepID=UPI0025406B2D|nr:glycosyltransferase family 4 protein [Caminicella sporogenes]WIF96084.1 glycosyltransferase family 4 protein [Caminicella sporogenes]
MNILYISQFFYPETNAGAFRAYENSYCWQKNNNNITVITTFPNYPKGKIYKGYSNKFIFKENIKGINVIRVKSIIKKNTRKINRLILYLSFLFFTVLNTLMGNIDTKQYDIVIGSSGPIFVSIYAYVISKIRRIPFILELRDITFIQMLGTFSSKGSYYYKTIKKLELFMCSKATRIIVTTNSFKEILISHGIERKKIDVIPNGVFVGKDLLNGNKDKKIKVNDNEIIFCYAGTFGISQDLIQMIDFFRNLDLNNKKLYLIGDGAEKQKILSYIKKHNLDNIIVLDSMPKEQLTYFYKQVDICIIKLKNTKEFSNFIPSKVFDIMYNAKPILYLGPKGEITDIIDKSNCGFYYCNYSQIENANDFSRYIKGYSDIKQFKIELSYKGKRGYEYCIKNYDREKLAKKYLAILEKLIEER